jgi:hypothetical protein
LARCSLPWVTSPPELIALVFRVPATFRRLFGLQIRAGFVRQYIPVNEQDALGVPIRPLDARERREDSFGRTWRPQPEPRPA